MTVFKTSNFSNFGTLFDTCFDPINGSVSDPVQGFLTRYRFDGSDVNLTRSGADDFRIAPTCPEAVGSQFNGTDQYYTGSDFSAIDGTQGAFSASFWFNSVDTSGTLARMIVYGNSAAAGDGFYIAHVSASGTIRFRSNGLNHTTSGNYTDGKNHFVVITYDGTTLKIYVDNVEDYSAVTTVNTFAPTSLTVGASSGGVTGFYNGLLDDFRYYDRVLTTQEMTDLYNYVCDFNPTQLTTPTWFDAQDQTTITESAGAVSQWDDKGGAFNVSQLTATNQPTTALSTINGLNALSFDTDDYMSNTSLTASLSQAQIITVGSFNLDAARAFQHLVRLDNSVTADVFSLRENEATGTLQGVTNTGSANTFTNSPTGLIYGDPFIGRQKYDGAVSVSGFNGVLGSSNATTGTIDIDEIFISFTANQLNGLIGEVVFIPSADEREGQKVEGYLAWKWGLVSLLPSDHPYKNVPPKV